MALLLLWMIVPLGMTLYFSLIRYNLLYPGENAFVGVENFTFFVTDAGSGAGLRGLLAGAEQLDDAAVFDDQAAGGVETVGGEDGEGIANPGAGHVRTFVGSAGRRERCRPSVDESQLSVHPVC